MIAKILEKDKLYGIKESIKHWNRSALDKKEFVLNGDELYIINLYRDLKDGEIESDLKYFLAYIRAEKFKIERNKKDFRNKCFSKVFYKIVYRDYWTLWKTINSYEKFANIVSQKYFLSKKHWEQLLFEWENRNLVL